MRIASNLMRSLSATRWQIFRMLQLPNAMPYIFAGLEIAMIFALIGAIVAELISSERGLGMLMQSMSFTMDVARAVLDPVHPIGPGPNIERARHARAAARCCSGTPRATSTPMSKAQLGEKSCDAAIRSPVRPLLLV